MNFFGEKIPLYVGSRAENPGNNTEMKFYFYVLSFLWICTIFNGDIETFGTQTSWQLITEWNGTGFVACTFLLDCCKGVADFWDCLAHTVLPLFAVFLLSPIRRFSSPHREHVAALALWRATENMANLKSLALGTLFSDLMRLTITSHETWKKSPDGQSYGVNHFSGTVCVCKRSTKLFGHPNWFIDF